jgi:GcrA cell cycle regulator
MKYRGKSAAGSTRTDKRVRRLKALWGSGLSAAQIATQLGAGISRNAVLGKILRLKLCRRRSRPAVVKNKPHRQHGFKRARAFVPRGLPHQDAIAAEPLHVAFANLGPSHCRWPYGDGPFTFCGLPISDGRSYCVHHKAIACRQRGPGRQGGVQLASIDKRMPREAA